MKRVLSLVLALVLVLGSMPLAFADEHMTAGDQLYEWNLIAGRSATEKDLDEEGTLTRAELMVLFAQLNGVAEEAESFELPSGFSDVAEDAWYAPWIAYGKMAGWTAGYPDGTFKPANAVSAQEMASFALNVLGYEVNWATALEDATAMGIDVEAMNTAMMTRGEGFAVMLAVVNTVPNGETEKLGVKLGVLEPEAPVVVVPEELEVVSVEALNLIQLEVRFNKAVDKDTAEDTDNYSVEDEDFDVEDASLMDDEMTVVLTLADAADQQGISEVTIEAVEDLDGNELDEVTFEVEFIDTTLPEVLKAEVVGNDTIKVYFSEPVEDAVRGDFEVDGGNLYVSGVEMVNNNTEANVELYSTLEEGTITIKAKNSIEDFAGFSILTTTFEIEVVEDDEAPTVVGYKNANPNEVTLIFNEDIEFVNESGTVYTYTSGDADFYHTNTNNRFDTATRNGKELKLEFDDYEMPEGTVYVYVAEETVNDLWDNENPRDIRVAVSIEVDTTKPTVKSVETGDSEEEIIVTFSESIKSVKKGYFTLLDADGDELEDEIRTATKSDDDEVTITLDSDDLSGKHSLVIEDVEDLAGNVIDKVTVDFEIEDVTAPVISTFEAILYEADDEEQIIKVSFDERMMTSGKYSVDDLEKYTLIDGTDSYDLADEDDVEISVVDNGKAVEIMIPEDTLDLVLNGGYELTIGRVADAAGNYSIKLSDTIDVDDPDFLTFSVETDLNADDDQIIVIEFDDLVTFDVEDFDFVQDGTTLTVARVNRSTNSDNETVIKIRFTTEFANDAVGLSYTVVGTETDNKYGQTVELGATGSVEDGIKPTVAENDDDDFDIVVVEGDTTTQAVVTVTFTELLSPAYRNDLSVVDVAGYDGSDIINVEWDDTTGVTVLTITIEVDEFDVFEFENEDLELASTLRDTNLNRIAETVFEIPEQ